MKQENKMNDEMYERLKAELEQLQSGRRELDNSISWEKLFSFLEGHSQYSHKGVVDDSGYISFYYHNTSDGSEFLTLRVSKDKRPGIVSGDCSVNIDWFYNLIDEATEMLGRITKD